MWDIEHILDFVEAAESVDYGKCMLPGSIAQQRYLSTKSMDREI